MEGMFLTIPLLWSRGNGLGPVYSLPIYRHPADSSPPLLQFSPIVETIRQHCARVLDQPLNHVLIQHYRSGADYISEHSDKTIDVVRGSSVINVSIGAQRTMTIRTKKDASVVDETTGAKSRSAERIPLPHNSMLVMGLDTNAKYLHSIRTDKRPVCEKTAEELAYDGERISLTFRHIGTFLTSDQTRIYGQGATAKCPEEARRVINGGEEAERLIVAFGEENHKTEFDWDGVYGRGFDVLHFNLTEIE